MARRRRYSRKRGRKSKPSVPLLAMAPVYPALFHTVEFVKAGKINDIPGMVVHQLTGISVTGAPFDQATATRQVSLVIGGMIGHKIANKTGVNRWLKKATMGYFTL